MAEVAKKKQKPLTSPRGKFLFAYLQTPDTKYDADGVYVVKVNTSAELAQPIIDAVDPLMTEALEEGKAKFKERYAEEKSEAKKKKMLKAKPEQADTPYMIEDDGTVTLSFKMKAKGKDFKTGEEYTRKPVLYDAKGNVITAALKIGNGTEGKVSYFLNKFYVDGTGSCGVSLRLCAAQILVLKEWGSADASYHGFGKEEDGFDGEALPSAEDLDLDGDEPEEAEEEGDEPKVAKDGKSADEF